MLKGKSMYTIKKFFNAIYATKAGGVVDSFQRWRTLPTPDTRDFKKVGIFEKGLASFYKKHVINYSWS